MSGVQVCGLLWMPLCQAEKQSICRTVTQTAWVFFFFFWFAHLLSSNAIQLIKEAFRNTLGITVPIVNTKTDFNASKTCHCFAASSGFTARICIFQIFKVNQSDFYFYWRLNNLSAAAWNVLLVIKATLDHHPGTADDVLGVASQRQKWPSHVTHTHNSVFTFQENTLLPHLDVPYIVIKGAEF